MTPPSNTKAVSINLIHDTDIGQDTLRYVKVTATPFLDKMLASILAWTRVSMYAAMKYILRVHWQQTLREGDHMGTSLPQAVLSTAG